MMLVMLSNNWNFPTFRSCLKRRWDLINVQCQCSNGMQWPPSHEGEKSHHQWERRSTSKRKWLWIYYKGCQIQVSQTWLRIFSLEAPSLGRKNAWWVIFGHPKLSMASCSQCWRKEKRFEATTKYPSTSKEILVTVPPLCSWWNPYSYAGFPHHGRNTSPMPSLLAKRLSSRWSFWRRKLFWAKDEKSWLKLAVVGNFNPLNRIYPLVN